MAFEQWRGRKGSDIQWDMDPMETVFSLLDQDDLRELGVVDTPRRRHARDRRAIVNTNVDWVETPSEHIFKVDLPGVKREDVTIEVEPPRTLKISGERPKEEAKDGETWHRVERARGRFMRKLKLPKHGADLDHIRAEYEDGVLTIRVPKEHPKKPEPRRIEIGPGSGGASQETSAGQVQKDPKDEASV